MDNLDLYIERLQNSYETTMRKMGNELSESKELSLTQPQYYILYLLSKSSYYTPSELSKKLGVKPSAVTVMIDRLLKTDLVKRERDESDRRIVKIMITKGGENVLQRAKIKRNEVIKRYLSYLEEHEIKSLVSIYEKLANISKKNSDSTFS